MNNKVEISPAAETDREVLRNLMQLYQYDFTESEGGDLNDHGLFEYRWLDNYWTEHSRHPFLIKVPDRLAGFVLVNEFSYLAPPGAKSIAEFFVMRKYRRQGIGRRVAIHIFREFPGDWEVRETIENTVAQRFWRTVIGEVTGGNFEERHLDDERWKGPIQIFAVAESD